MSDLLRGPVTTANLTAAVGVLTGVDGWWPCLNLTWRTPVPTSITRLVAQVRLSGTASAVAETVVTPGDGAASIVNGVGVGQHLQVRLAPAGAPGLPFRPTPWLDLTTTWDALIAAAGAAGGAPSIARLTSHTETNTDYTLTAVDAFAIVYFSSAAGNTCTVPAPASIGFAISGPTTPGTPVAFKVLPGSMPIQIEGAVGVTVNPPIGKNDLKFRAGDGGQLVPIGANTWDCW